MQILSSNITYIEDTGSVIQNVFIVDLIENDEIKV